MNRPARVGGAPADAARAPSAAPDAERRPETRRPAEAHGSTDAHVSTEVHEPAETHRSARPHRPLPPDEYNYEHFRTKHLLGDARRTARRAGIRPGAEAPDFELPKVGGGSLRLSDLRGRPVLLRFGSVT